VTERGNTDPRKARLELIRSRLARLQDHIWQTIVDEHGTGIETKRASGGGHEAPVPFCRFTNASQVEIKFFTDAVEDMKFLLGLLDQAFAQIRQKSKTSTDAEENGPNYAAEASMKCDDNAFRVFLAERHPGDHPDMENAKDLAVARLKSALKIKSRKELTRNAEAAARWRDLRAEFELWARR
tara:strand:+ start:7042 stop:7590 length:549 start_codon:yes stop_codon:yes gene_type:complete